MWSICQLNRKKNKLILRERKNLSKTNPNETKALFAVIIFLKENGEYNQTKTFNKSDQKYITFKR